VTENHDAHVRAWVDAVQDRAVAEAGALTEIAMGVFLRNLPPDRKWFSLEVKHG
jgi:hypothetical protein